MLNHYLSWGLFNLFILGMLLLDLGVFHRHSHVISKKEGLLWTCFWVVLALAFNVLIYLTRGSEDALSFFTGYLIEKALSVDNIFVFLVLFRYFQVPKAYMHKVLSWGIIGALVMRAAMIFAGITLIEHFHWLLYVFGAFLIYTGVQLAIHKEYEVSTENNLILRLIKKFLPITHEYHEDHFFIKKSARYFATPLFVVLILIESSDLIFALDSIPAILAITRDPFIVYSSNVFAILGLRSLFFSLSGMMTLFHHLHYGLAFILSFIGTKMLIEPFYEIPLPATLLIVASTLIITCTTSLMHPQQNK